ncbi:MAG: hypothetical protein IPM54_12385 [Polyangiaceae bacterium]|nr:hypothetical protein [Polyangiaceae bacterium]
MKQVISMRIRAHDLPEGATGLFEATGCKLRVTDIEDFTVLNVHQVIVWLKFDAEDPLVMKVREYLKKHGVEPWGGEYTEYSDEDRQNARLLWMRPANDVEICAGFNYGTEYDLTNACPNCHAGAKQTSVLYVDNDEIATIRKHRAVQAWTREVLVDGGMRKKLVDAGITGISFGDVRARHENGKWSMVARDQILIEHSMPPMRGELSAKDEEYLCKVCRRGGRMSSPDKPYREEDLVGMKDFNLTWEWFGEFWAEDKEKRRSEKAPESKRPRHAQSHEHIPRRWREITRLDAGGHRAMKPRQHNLQSTRAIR